VLNVGLLCMGRISQAIHPASITPLANVARSDGVVELHAKSMNLYGLLFTGDEFGVGDRGSVVGNSRS